jgi:membrane protein YqaA with SNARE-associated domain
MHRAVVWIQLVLVPWLGAPGAFLVAFLDSSFLSLPEINDLIVVMAAVSHPETVWLFALMATLGSLAGCAVLWWLGRRGGEGLLLRRFGAERVRQVRRAFERWNILALAVPAVLPPPMPFKVFVIAAGVFGLPFRRFATTLLMARGLRYAVWGVLGILYGERALAILKAADHWFSERSAILLASFAVVTLAIVLAAMVLRRRRGMNAAADGASLV